MRPPLRLILRGGTNTSRSSSSTKALEPDLQIGDGGAKIGLGLRGPFAERSLHLAHALRGFIKRHPPGRRFRQCTEQAFVEKIVLAMNLAAKGRPIAARGSQDDAIG